MLSLHFAPMKYHIKQPFLPQCCLQLLFRAAVKRDGFQRGWNNCENINFQRNGAAAEKAVGVIGSLHARTIKFILSARKKIFAPLYIHRFVNNHRVYMLYVGRPKWRNRWISRITIRNGARFAARRSNRGSDSTIAQVNIPETDILIRLIPAVIAIDNKSRIAARCEDAHDGKNVRSAVRGKSHFPRILLLEKRMRRGGTK